MFRRRYSKIAIKWIKWESEKRQIRIQHAMNGGETLMGGYYLDGYAGPPSPADPPLAFEFNGFVISLKNEIFFCR